MTKSPPFELVAAEGFLGTTGAGMIYPGIASANPSHDDIITNAPIVITRSSKST
jgi:hypothetical protein